MSLSIEAAAAVRVLPGYGPTPDVDIPFPVPGLAEGLRVDVPLAHVRYRRLRGREEVDRILHLREEIRLPREVREAPAFVALEKKETKTGSWACSSTWADPSGPCVCFR